MDAAIQLRIDQFPCNASCNDTVQGHNRSGDQSGEGERGDSDDDSDDGSVQVVSYN